MIYSILFIYLLLNAVYSQEDEEVTVEIYGEEGMQSNNYWGETTEWTTLSTSNPPISYPTDQTMTTFNALSGHNRSENESEEACRDTLPNCVERKKLCEMILYGPLVTQFCAKTCGRCREYGRLTRDQKCRDNDPRCATLVQLGFCFSNHNETTKVKYCRRSCGLCDVSV